MFYTYIQNNSGGHFNVHKRLGITHIVIIQADTVEEADDKAGCIGIYFDGTDNDTDCAGCGDRWEPASKHDSSGYPSIYGQTVKQYLRPPTHLWMKPGFEVCIHYKDGTKVWS